MDHKFQQTATTIRYKGNPPQLVVARGIRGIERGGEWRWQDTRRTHAGSVQGRDCEGDTRRYTWIKEGVEGNIPRSGPLHF